MYRYKNFLIFFTPHHNYNHTTYHNVCKYTQKHLFCSLIQLFNIFICTIEICFLPLPKLKRYIMKKIIYYSPFIPVIGFITHIMWIKYKYDIFSIDKPIPICYIPSILQGIYFGTIISYIF